MPRRRYPTITEGSDGLFHAWVPTGQKRPNGRPIQKHVKRATYDEVQEEVDRLLAQKKTGAAPKVGRAPTIQQWLTTYLDTIAPRRCDPTTIQGYRSKMRCYVYPVMGTVRLGQEQPEHLDAVYTSMQRLGRADATILQVHRILSRALEVAFRRGHTARNVAKLIDDEPTAKKIEMKSLSEPEAQRILDAAVSRRNSARWPVGLGLGLRQGEVLGLRWPYVDLEAQEMRVWWQLHRRAWEHGCGGKCGRKRGGNCPERTIHLRSGEFMIEGLVMKEPKGKSKRTIPIPVELVEWLEAHREIQNMEKQWAEGAYADHGLVFARPDGKPVDPSADWDEWKSLLADAEVPDARVHDGRHTAATLLLAMGVPAEVVQEILGHSSIVVTRGYMHVASEMAKKATDRMGKSLLKRPGTP